MRVFERASFDAVQWDGSDDDIVVGEFTFPVHNSPRGKAVHDGNSPVLLYAGCWVLADADGGVRVCSGADFSRLYDTE